jgi:ribonuclease P protein component
MPQFKHTFPRSESLKSRKAIQHIFLSGKKVFSEHILMVYAPWEWNDTVKVKVGVSASKRNFKKAVDRNRVKRLMREAYRQNKKLILDNINSPCGVMLVCVSKQIPQLRDLVMSLEEISKKLKKKADENVG